AEEARRYLAALGFRSVDEAVGRVECLLPRAERQAAAALLDLGPVLAPPGDGPRGYVGDAKPVAEGSALGLRLAREAAPALEGAALVEPSYEIGTSDRTVGARLGALVAREVRAGRPPGRARARFS